jgi:RimJ/RimL family protein N-acetyltransferase
MGFIDKEQELREREEPKQRGLWRFRTDRKAEPDLRAKDRLHHWFLLFKSLNIADLFHKVKHRFYSQSLSYCLRRDLAIPIETPKAKIPISIRKLRASDISILLNLDDPSLSDQERRERTDRLVLLKEGVETCYVAVDQSDRPCYMQWLIGPNENLSLQRIFSGGFPWLESNEALLEDAFTPESHRGLGIMSCAMAQIAERGSAINARYIITFVHDQNIPSLKGCKRAGFVPYMLRYEKNRFFRRTISFSLLPAGTPYPFDTKANT